MFMAIACAKDHCKGIHGIGSAEKEWKEQYSKKPSSLFVITTPDHVLHIEEQA